MGSYQKNHYIKKSSRKRSPETIAKWKASRGIKLGTLDVLNEEHKNFVCRLIAEFESPKEIVRRMEEIYHVSIGVPAVYNYSVAKKWQPVINHYRTQYSKMLNHIPIFHKRQRLERLERQYQDLEKLTGSTKKTAKEVRFEERQILRQALDECSVWEKKDGNTTNYVSIQYNNMEDSDLLKRRDELVKRISKYKEIPNGAVQADSSGRGGEGIPPLRSQSKPAIDPVWEAEQAAREQRILLGEEPQEGAIIDAPQ